MSEGQKGLLRSFGFSMHGFSVHGFAIRAFPTRGYAQDDVFLYVFFEIATSSNSRTPRNDVGKYIAKGKKRIAILKY
jgi:hypothetical protein